MTNMQCAALYTVYICAKNGSNPPPPTSACRTSVGPAGYARIGRKLTRGFFASTWTIDHDGCMPHRKWSALAFIQEIIRPAFFQEIIRPAFIQEMIRSAFIREMIRPAYIQEMIRPAFIQETLIAAFIQEMIIPLSFRK
jgi:hypothetical protein